MYAFRRLSCPNFFHPSTNRRMYRLLSSGLIGEACGLPRPSSRFRVLRRLFPRSSVSSTGASSHILIRWSMFPSTTRRATDFRSSECGREFKVGAEICIYDFPMASVDQLMDLSYCVQCAAVFPIGVLFRLQVGLEYGFENQNCRHLRCPVADSGDSQRELHINTVPSALLESGPTGLIPPSRYQHGD